jgi:hypothetical protein
MIRWIDVWRDNWRDRLMDSWEDTRTGYSEGRPEKILKEFKASYF